MRKSGSKEIAELLNEIQIEVFKIVRLQSEQQYHSIINHNEEYAEDYTNNVLSGALSILLSFEKILEGHMVQDHVHMLIRIPPKYAVSEVIGYLKGKKALRLSQKQVEYFIKGCNIFPHRSERYFIFESENTGEDVEGLDNVVFWKEPTIPVKPIGTTEDGEIKLFSLPKASL